MIDFTEEWKKPAPCEGCWHRDACKHQLLACKQFAIYVATGRLASGQRHPTRKIWQHLFVEDIDTPHELKELLAKEK